MIKTPAQSSTALQYNGNPDHAAAIAKAHTAAPKAVRSAPFRRFTSLGAIN
jgi:hypothetical protein